MGERRLDRSIRNAIASELVGHDPRPLLSLRSYEPAQESLRRSAISPGLDQNVDDIAVLIDGALQVLLPATDLHEDFVEVPHVPEALLAALWCADIGWPELQAPLSDRLVRNLDTPVGEQVLHVAETHAGVARGTAEVSRPVRELQVDVRKRLLSAMLANHG